MDWAEWGSVYTASWDSSAHVFRVSAVGTDSGEVEWQTTLPRENPSERIASVNVIGKQVILVGNSWTVDTHNDFMIAAFDAKDGSLEWSTTYDGGHSDDVVIAATSGESNVLFVTGQAGPEKETTIAYSVDRGDALWIHTDSRDSSSYGADIQVDEPSSQVYVTGGIIGEGSGRDFFLQALDSSSGQLLWWHSFDGPAHMDEESPHVALNGMTKRIYVAGSTTNRNGNLDYVLLAYEMAGDLAWLATYDGDAAGNDEIRDLAVAADGSHVIVTGSSAGFPPDVDGNYDYLTISYSADGRPIREARFNYGANADDTAHEIAIDFSSNAVYVTGVSSIAETHVGGLPDNGLGSLEIDAVTIRYSFASKTGEPGMQSSRMGP